MRIRLLTTIMACLLLTIGCASKTQPGGTGSLDELQQLSSVTKPSLKNQNNAIRLQALRDTALSLGAQSGLAAHSDDVNAATLQHAKTLDRVFNFHAIMLPHNVLPPVLAEGRTTSNIEEPDTIRLADRVYKIESQARFVTAPPNWRDYVWLSYPQPDLPHDSLLPQNSKEREIWKEAVSKGWEHGIQQADSIFAANLARLKRDYSGMVLYRNLLAKNMVSPPYVATANLGITGNGSDMRINDQILRITALPSLQTNSKSWRPAVSK